MAILEVIVRSELEQATLLSPGSCFAWLAGRDMAQASSSHKCSVLVAEIETSKETREAYMEHNWQGKFLDLCVGTEDYEWFL